MWLIINGVLILILLKVLFEIWSPIAEVRRNVLKLKIHTIFLKKTADIIDKEYIRKELKKILDELKVNKYATKEELITLLRVDDLKLIDFEKITKEEIIVLFENYLKQ